MKFFSLISNQEIKTSGEKIIPAKEFSSLKKAEEILKQVKSESLEYKKKIAIECETLKESAFKQGFDEGLAKLNENILKLDKEINKFEEEMQKKILPIALKAAKKILGEELKLHPDRIIDIVIQALKPVTQHYKIKIFVNKQDLDILESSKEKIKAILEQVKTLSIVERDDIEPGGCIIETEAGIINAQLENQWRALEIAFENFMKK
jgi:type III secretion protein L